MELDDELCLCFHVTKRKVINFLRVEKPVRAGQLSECFGAGTGCGWCRGYLGRLFNEYQAKARSAAVESEATSDPAIPIEAEPTAADYARQRGRYIRAGGGTPPPGATPPAPDDSPSNNS